MPPIKSGTFVDHVDTGLLAAGRLHAAFLVGTDRAIRFLLHAGRGSRTRANRFTPGRPDTITGLFVVDSLLTGNMAAFWSSLSHLVLPSIILGWFTLALVARITRSSMLEVLSQDYIRTARAKGLAENWVISGMPCATP